MQSLEELEAELLRCQTFLSQRDVSLQNEGRLDTNTIEVDELPGQPPPRGKPKTLEELLALLDDAPAGPVELDPALLYSPGSSVAARDSVNSLNEPSFRFGDPPAAHQAAPPHGEEEVENRPGPLGRTYHSQRRAARRTIELVEERQREEMAECTFNPRTGRPPAVNHGSVSSRAVPRLPVEERLLLTAGQRRAASARALREERDEAERAHCTFAPRLVTQPERMVQGSRRRPIHERLNDEWRRKEEAMEAAAARASEGLTFAPELNPLSLRLAANRKTAKKHARSAGTAANVPSSPSFQPAINPTSSRLLELSSTVPSDFHRRQQHFDRRREEHRRVLAAGGLVHRDCTFRPHTSGTATTMLALSDRLFEQAIEGPQERWERMAVGEAKDRDMRRAAREVAVRAEEYSPFAPRLNPRSLKIAAAAKGRRPATDIVAATESHRARRAAVISQELRDCTFFPDTSKPPVLGYYDEYQPPHPSARLSIAAASVGGPEALTASIDEYRAAKERWAAEEREKEERKKMAECTFTPDTRQSKKSAAAAGGSQSVAVPGMERFWEVKKLAERQQAELEERTAKAFILNPRSPRDRGPTVPQPFKLAGAARREQLAQARRREAV